MAEAPATVETTHAEYAAGDLIENRYRLERLLGEGAQGSVWLAHNIGLDARVAIKLVHAERASELPTLRLEKEARAAARLGHPGVVRVFDFGRTPTGDAFIVMEYLRGQNLGETLFGCGRLPAVQSLRTLLPIADALVAAHARGIVHRDLKPENIFLSQDGESIQPKLLDFGIAKLAGPGRPGGGITMAGALVGSPAYVSPEQAACRDDVSEHTDVWSFCVVLYECLTGQVPFESEDYAELFRRIGNDTPESILDHGVGDLELWEIIRRGLAKSPAERWPTMLSLGRALASWLRAHGVREDICGVLLEPKWLARTRSDPTAVLSEIEPSSFVRRIERHPALRTTERAPTPSLLKRYGRVGVLGGIALAAVALVFGLVWARSSKPPIPIAPTSSSVAGTTDDPSLQARARATGNTPLAGGPLPSTREAKAVDVRPLGPAPSTEPLAKDTRASSPRPVASDTAQGSHPPPSASGETRTDLLNPY
jgi:serine/threonine protein kinase